MERMFKKFKLNGLDLANRFVFPPVKTGYGTPQGEVTQRQLMFYQQIAKNGPGILILEPVAVTLDGKEHPKQLCVHLPHSSAELKKIVGVIHNATKRAQLWTNAQSTLQLAVSNYKVQVVTERGHPLIKLITKED